MHRAALEALTAALALLVAALGAPSGSAQDLTDTATITPVAAAFATPLAVPVELAKPTKACRAGLVALTFDDGPNPVLTPRLVRILQKYRVPATFFVVGSRVQSSPRTARLLQRSGFLIGNHSWSHRQLTAISDAAVRRELRRTQRALRAAGIVPSDLMRPPYGAISRRVTRDVHGLGLVPVLWSIDSSDWVGGNARQIARRVLSGLRPHRSNIVLQHDGVTNSPRSIAAVPLIISGARKRGYCFTLIGPHGKMAPLAPAVRVSVVPGSEDGASPIRVRLDLDGPTTRAVSLRVRTSGGTATAGSDYTPVDLRVVFPKGVRTVWFSVPVLDDKLLEPTEDVRLVIDQANGVRLNRSVVLGSIFSDELG